MILILIRRFRQNRPGWWQPPRLRDGEQAEVHRKATWLELFFDLVFVAVVAELSKELATHVNFFGVTRFVLLYAPVWWIWIGATFYNDRFETDDVSHRLLTFLLMIPIGGFAVFAHGHLVPASKGLAMCYIFARSISLVMWIRAGVHNKVARPLAISYVKGFGCGMAFWIASLWAPIPMRFFLWLIGMIVDLITPLTTLEYQAKKMPRFSDSHLPERFGLFMIIVLGESVIGVIHAFSNIHHPALIVYVTAFLGMFLAFSLWWVYFDDIMGHQMVPRIPWTVPWTYGHLILCLGLTAVGAGVVNAVEYNTHTLAPEIRWLMCGSIAISLIMVSIIEYAHDRGVDHSGHHHESQRVNIRIIGAIAAVILGLIGTSISGITCIAILLGLMVIQVASGVRLKYRGQ